MMARLIVWGAIAVVAVGILQLLSRIGGGDAAGDSDSAGTAFAERAIFGAPESAAKPSRQASYRPSGGVDEADLRDIAAWPGARVSPARRAHMLVEDGDWGIPTAVVETMHGARAAVSTDRFVASSIFASAWIGPEVIVAIRGTLSSEETQDAEFDMELRVSRRSGADRSVEGVVRYGRPVGGSDYANRIRGVVRGNWMVLSEGETLWTKRGVPSVTGREFSIELPDVDGRVTGTWSLRSLNGQLAATVGIPLWALGLLRE